jgi:hypothetical protein
MTIEKQEHPRLAKTTPARIMVPLSCALVEISGIGAKLRVDESLSLPDEFILEVRLGVSRWCRVLRRDSDHVQIQFINPPFR